MPRRSRKSLLLILDQSFTGIYRWHANRTLRSIRWVKAASKDGRHMGLAMFTMVARRAGYLYYIAVSPAHRRAGIGGLLLDDFLAAMRAAGAAQAFACARADNTPSIRLLQSRHFERTDFGELVRSMGFARAAVIWIRMFVAPGEKVYTQAIGTRGG